MVQFRYQNHFRQDSIDYLSESVAIIQHVLGTLCKLISHGTSQCEEVTQLILHLLGGKIESVGQRRNHTFFWILYECE